MSSLESVWEYREEILYPQLFGEQQRGICTLTFELFDEILKDTTVDPRWLHLGAVEFAPMAKRQSWLYVTSGGSTPWEGEPADYKKDEYSWLGVEFVIETTEQADWAINILLRLMA